jgi:hypothetical protein
VGDFEDIELRYSTSSFAYRAASYICLNLVSALKDKYPFEEANINSYVRIGGFFCTEESYLI